MVRHESKTKDISQNKAFKLSFGLSHADDSFLCVQILQFEQTRKLEAQLLRSKRSQPNYAHAHRSPEVNRYDAEVICGG